MPELQDQIGNVTQIRAKFESTQQVFMAGGDERASQRVNIYRELIETEIAYIKDLKLIGKAEKEQIMAAFDKGPFAKNPKARKGYKALLKQYIAISAQQEKMLEVYLTDNPRAWAKEFVKMEGLYRNYVMLYNKYQKYGQLPKQDIPFLSSPKTNPGNLDLGDFIIKPVQRIAKIPLLTNELVKATPEGENLTALQESYNKIRSTITNINEAEQAEIKALKLQQIIDLPKSKPTQRLKEISLFFADFKTVPKENLVFLKNADLTEYLNKLDLSGIDLNQSLQKAGENSKLLITLRLIDRLNDSNKEVKQQNLELIDSILQAKIKRDLRNKELIAADKFPINEISSAMQQGQLYAISDAHLKELGKNIASKKMLFKLGGEDGAMIHKNLQMLQKMGISHFEFSPEAWKAYHLWQAELTNKGYEAKPVLIEIGADPQKALEQAKQFQAQNIPVAFTSPPQAGNVVTRFFQERIGGVLKEKNPQADNNLQALKEAEKTGNEKIQTILKAINEGKPVPALVPQATLRTPETHKMEAQETGATSSDKATSLPVKEEANPSKPRHPILSEISQLGKQITKIQQFAKEIEFPDLKAVNLRPFVDKMWNSAQEVVGNAKTQVSPFMKKRKKEVTNIAKKVPAGLNSTWKAIEKVEFKKTFDDVKKEADAFIENRKRNMKDAAKKIPGAQATWRKAKKVKPKDAYLRLAENAKRLKNQLIKLKNEAKKFAQRETDLPRAQKEARSAFIKLIKQALSRLKQIFAFISSFKPKDTAKEDVIQRTAPSQSTAQTVGSQAPLPVPLAAVAGSAAVTPEMATAQSKRLSFSAKAVHPLITEIKQLEKDIVELESLAQQMHLFASENTTPMSVQVQKMLDNAQKALRTFGTAQEREASAQAAEQKKQEIAHQLHQQKETLQSNMSASETRLSIIEPDPKKAFDKLLTKTNQLKAALIEAKKVGGQAEDTSQAKNQAGFLAQVDSALGTLEKIGGLLNQIKPKEPSPPVHRAKPGAAT